VEDHAQFTSVRADSLDELLLVIDARHLTDTESIILLEDGTKLLQELVATRSTGVVLGTGMHGAIRVGERLVLADEVDDIEAEAVAATVQPEPHDVVDSISHLGILPVQIRLLFAEEMEIILVRSFIILPSTACFLP
jgi:hypothetical protein